MEKIKTEYGYKTVYSNGDTYHYNHQGEYHNPYGPADDTELYKAYYVNGVLHRTDGPAYEDTYGSKLYFKDGKPHRTDGPAIINHGIELHFVNGKYVWKL